jgi:hypothetical protein
MSPTEKMLKKMGISLEEFGEVLTDENVIDIDCEIIDDDEEE